jgi:hypothetical protein
MSKPTKNKNVMFPVSALYIQLDTNTGENGASEIHLLKRSMIKMPKMNTQPILTSEYPFFTKNVRYPNSIEKKDWKTKYEFFFNRVLFMDRLRKEIAKKPDIYRERPKSKDEHENEDDELYEWMKKTEKHNIMVTLRALFPIPEVFGKALKTSHDHILNNDKYNSRVIWDVNVRSATNIFGFMYKFGIANKEKEEYFINLGGKRYSVDDVIWENDLVNHPVYNKFLKSQRETYEDVERSAQEVAKKNSGYLQKLNDDLTDMKTKEKFQKDFFKYSGECENDTDCENDEKRIEFLKKIKNSQDKDVAKFVLENIQKNKPLPQTQYLIHKYYFKPYYDECKHELNDDKNMHEDMKHNMEELVKSYDAIQNLKIDERNLTGLLKDKDKINSEWHKELEFSFGIEHAEDETINDEQEKYEEKLFSRIYADLKMETIFNLRMNIHAKNASNQSTSQLYVTNNDRKTTAITIEEKLKRLTDETGEVAANTIISIKDDLDNHKMLHSNEGISVFMERDYELVFERLLKNAIEIKASSIVTNFAKNHIPMNLSGKKPDGTDVSPINQRINQYIRDYFGTEANINNQLSTNVNNVFEPVRKTSNRELYKAIKLFKLGDSIMKREHNMTNSEIEEYRHVLETIHDKYISMQNRETDNDDDVDEYLYTGIDGVKTIATESTDGTKSDTEIRRNVQEIYVRMDLVSADAFENTPKASCKLLDKELEQEYMYLSDPRNKNNSILSRFRNLDIGSLTLQNVVGQQQKPEVVDSSKPVKKTGGTRRLNIKEHNDNHRKTYRRNV